MKKVRPFPKGTQQYLTFTGPSWTTKIHPVVRSESCTFLSTRFPKLVTIGNNQQAALRQVTA